MAISLNFPMPIVTERLIIRPPRIRDALEVNEAIVESFEVLHQFTDWAKNKPSLAESEEQIDRSAENWILKNNDDPWFQLFIFEKDTDEFIGAARLHHLVWEKSSVEIGYWVRISKSGRGLITEAINAITQYAFKELRVKRIGITCDVDNLKSKAVPERLSYILESTLKANRKKPVTGELSDTLVYARYNLDGLPALSVKWIKD